MKILYSKMSKFHNPKYINGWELEIGFAVLIVLMVGANIHFPSESSDSPQTEMNQNSLPPRSADPGDFISVWDTRFTSLGSSGSNQICLPLISECGNNFSVNWGDGTTNIIIRFNQPETTHSYLKAGVYTVVITGTIKGWTFDDNIDKLKIIEISQWGNLQFGNIGRYFRGCSNLKLTAVDGPNLEGITSIYKAFADCANLGSNGNMNSWNVSSVIDMGSMFDGASSFNQPLDSWNVSSVTNMAEMFKYASSFNHPLSAWNVSSVTYKAEMFKYASSFNHPLNTWDVSSVTIMHNMFERAYSFDQPLNNWNVSSVTNMGWMFYEVTLSSENYNNLLIDWSQLSLQFGVEFNGGKSRCSSAEAKNARTRLIDHFGWILDDGDAINHRDIPSPSPTQTSTTQTSTSVPQISPSSANHVLNIIAISGIAVVGSICYFLTKKPSQV